jgi:hypothetical protein
MYSLIIPPEIISELYRIRGKTGRSIRKQILTAVNESIEHFKNLEAKIRDEFITADILLKADGGEKNGTA